MQARSADLQTGQIGKIHQAFQAQARDMLPQVRFFR